MKNKNYWWRLLWYNIWTYKNDLCLLLSRVAVTVKTSFTWALLSLIQFSGVRPPGVCADAQWIWETHDVGLQSCAGGSGGPHEEASSCLIPGEVTTKHVVNPVYTRRYCYLKWRKSNTLPVWMQFFRFAAHRLPLWCRHSSAQGATVFPKVFLPKAPVNKHKGAFALSFLPTGLSDILVLTWHDWGRSSLHYLLPHAFQAKPSQCKILSSWLWRWRESCNMVQHQDSSERFSLSA